MLVVRGPDDATLTHGASFAPAWAIAGAASSWYGTVMSLDRSIYVTQRDLERLQRLLETHGSRRDAEACTALEDELGHAVVVEPTKITPDVVTMNSRVRFEDLDTGEQLEMTLVYPKDADVNEGRVSVLAPVGSALLGLSVGQSIQWPLPGEKNRHLRVVSVTYQPEAAGDLDL